MKMCTLAKLVVIVVVGLVVVEVGLVVDISCNCGKW